MKASDFLAQRNQLLLALGGIDADIDLALKARRSQRAANKAKKLFQDRQQVVDLLAAFGVDVEAHPAVWSRENSGG